MFPEAGGSSSFARRAFNEFWSFFAAWAGMLTYTVTIAISAFFVPHYIGGLFSRRAAPRRRATSIAGCVVIARAGGVNVFGAKESTGINVTLAVVDFLTQLLLVLIGVFLVFSPETLVDNVHARHRRRRGTNFILAIPIGMLAYTGIETVSNMAEEAKDEATTIPAAINRVRIAVFAIYFTLPAVALSALPVTQQRRRVPDPARPDRGGGRLRRRPGARRGQADGPRHRSRTSTEIYVGLLAATILFLATNAGIIGVSRLVYSMGIHRQMPDALRRLHPRFRTPWIGILVFSGAAIVLILPGPGDAARQRLLVRRAAVVHDGARRRSRACAPSGPTSPRPYRGPGQHPIGDYDAPLFALVGGGFTAIAFVVIVVLNLPVAAIGTGWLIVGMVVYAVYRRRQGLDLTSTHKVAIAQPVVDHEAEYDSVLVHFGDDGYDEQMLATAVKLAARKRRGIHVLVTITVPNALPDRRVDARGRGRGRLDHRAGAAAGRRRASPGTGRRCAPARPGGGSSRRRRTCARPRS